MKINQKTIVYVILITLTLSLIPISQVQAAGGILDKTCLNCNGVGTTPHNKTVTCPTCDGLKTINVTNTCDKCNGTKVMMIGTPCSVCGGSGKMNPPILTKSTTGSEEQIGSGIICRIVLNNQADQATYVTCESTVVITGGIVATPGTYVTDAPRVLLPPHTDVSVGIATGGDGFGFFLTFTYQIYVKAADQITCTGPCKGAGGIATNVTCNRCLGVGTLTSIETCTECQGVGTVTALENLTCTVCNGTGYVTDNSKVTYLVVAVVAVAVVVGGFGAFMLRKGKSRTLSSP
jgi:DnaJ-class molecular chaperone